MLMLSSRTTNRFQHKSTEAYYYYIVPGCSWLRTGKKVEIVSRIARVARKTTHHINDG